MKKIFLGLFLVFLLLTYFNVGYYVGEGIYNAKVKVLKGEPRNLAEEFLTFPGGVGATLDQVTKTKTRTICVAMFIWPLTLIFLAGSWIVMGIIVGAPVVWQGLAWLFKFVFCGGFFKLIGPVWTVSILVILLFLFMTWIEDRKIERKK